MRDEHFEWDDRKAAANERKHRVTFEEAASAFRDPDLLLLNDPDHSMEEERYLAIGISDAPRLVVVSHTDRGIRTRIITARPANRRELLRYRNQGHA